MESGSEIFVLKTTGTSFLVTKEFIFLSQSRERGRKDFMVNNSGGVYFYDCRMKIALEMMREGFILHPFDETRDKQHKESHEIELLCREPLYAGMGNIHPTPFDASIDMSGNEDATQASLASVKKEALWAQMALMNSPLLSLRNCSAMTFSRNRRRQERDA